MTRLTSLTAASLILWSAACKKDDKAGGEAGKAPTAAPAKDPGKAPPAGDAAEQKDLKVDVAGTAMGPLYGVAQQESMFGNTYRLLFVARPVTCATLEQVLMDGGEAVPYFTVHVQEALKPDGSVTWAYRQAAFGMGATAPAGLVPMPAFAIDDGKATGTLPDGVGHDDSTKGTLTAAGGFSVPVCDPIAPMKLRDLADFTREATPIEATGSTMKVSVAGRSFDVKGATAVPTPDGEELEVRLSATPHGCSMEVRDDLYLTVRVGGELTKLALCGHLIAGSSDYAEVADGLKVESKQGDKAVELSLDGALDYAHDGATYEVEASGKVTAPICEVER